MDRTMGMRESAESPSLSTLRPRKFAASAPVASTIATVRMMPSPGRWKPKSLSLRKFSGTSSSDWSMTSTSSFNAQIVMPSGIHTSSPAMKYRLNVTIILFGGLRGSRRGGGRRGLGGLGVGFRGGLVGARLRIVRLRIVRLRIVGLRRGLRAAVLEIGRVPAASLQLEARGGHHLREGRLAALRAHLEKRVAHLLQGFLLVAAALAAILVDGHDASPKFSKITF